MLTPTDRPYPASPPTNYASQTPAPFYVAGAEVPSQYPPRDDHQQQPPQQHPPASSPSPQQQPPQQFVPYSQPVAAAPPAASPPPAGINRVPVPVNNYSGAQELATSVYDSPIAPNPHGGLHSPPAGAGGAPAPQPTWQASAPVYAQQPASSPPPIPTDQPPQVPQEGMVPLPLRPGGPQQQQQHEPSAPSPNDYYRSGVY